MPIGLRRWPKFGGEISVVISSDRIDAKAVLSRRAQCGRDRGPLRDVPKVQRTTTGMTLLYKKIPLLWELPIWIVGGDKVRPFPHRKEQPNGLYSQNDPPRRP